MDIANIEKLTFRPAKKEDARAIAELYSISSDGVADYIWTTLAEEGEDILDVGQRRYEREDTDFSFQNCTMAVLDEEIIGMLVAFPMYVDKDADLSDVDPVLKPYCILEEDNSYYVCGVAVYEKYRGKGIGHGLMALAEEKAHNLGFRKLSLIVFEENAGAKKLYDNLGYAEVAREKVAPHPLIHCAGDAILMIKEIVQ